MPNFKLNPLDNRNYIAGFITILAGGPTVVTSGRTYASGVVVSLDRFNIDLPILKSSGWTVIADHTGATAARPSDLEHGVALPNGFRYLDTTLGKVVIRSNGQWLDINTGLVA
jgi:hypothetical protein